MEYFNFSHNPKNNKPISNNKIPNQKLQMKKPKLLKPIIKKIKVCHNRLQQFKSKIKCRKFKIIFHPPNRKLQQIQRPNRIEIPQKIKPISTKFAELR